MYDFEIFTTYSVPKNTAFCVLGRSGNTPMLENIIRNSIRQQVGSSGQLKTEIRE